MICPMEIVFLNLPNPLKLEALTPISNPERDPSKSGVLPPSPEKGEGDNDSDIEMSLRLVCSMSGNRSKAFWEDVTDTTPMTVVLKNQQI